MPKNVRSVSIHTDENLGMVQIMLEAKLTNPYDSSDKRVCTHSVLDLNWALTKEDEDNGFRSQADCLALAKDIVATIDRCLSIDRNGY